MQMLKNIFTIILTVFSFPFFITAQKFDSLENVVKTSKNDTCILKALLILSETCEQSQMMKYAEPGVKLAEQKLKSVDKSDPLYKTYLEYLAAFYHHLAYISELKSDIPKALQLNQASLRIYEQLKQKPGMSACYINIGAIYEKQKEVEKALEYYMLSLKMHEELKDKSGAASSLNNIAQVYANAGKMEKAIECYNSSLKIREEIKDKMGLGYSYNNLGAAYFRMGDLDKALQYMENALAVRELANHKEGVSETIHNISVIYFRKGDLNKSKEFALRGLKIGKEIGFPRNISNSANTLFKIYEKQNNYKDALQMYKLNIFMRDSIVNEENYRATVKNQMQNQYEKKTIADSIEKKLASIKIGNQQLLIKQEKNQKMFLFGGLALLLILAMVLFNRFRVTQKQKLVIESQKKIVEESLTQKEILLKEIHHRVKNNLQVISGILELQAYNTGNNDLKELVWEGQNRVKSIALIHQKLYQSENISVIPFQEYLDDLVKSISSTFKNKTEMSLFIDAGSFHFDVDTAVPLGLIINELITNCYKHAFVGEQNAEVHLKIIQVEANNFQLTLKDNGKGIPENYDINTSGSLGLQLVKGLSRQLKGSFNFRNNNGAEFNILFKNNIYTKA